MFTKLKSVSLLFISLILFLASCTGTPPTTPSSERPGTGLVLTDEKTLAALPFDDKLPRATKLPESVDLSVSFPTPGNQGNQGSCVGWAAAYLKTYQEVVETGEDPNSIFFSPSFIYNQIKKGSDCDSGSQIDDALNLLSEQGDVSEARFPYKDSRCDVLPNDEKLLEEAGPFRIASWRRANTQDPTELKRHLFNETPVLIAFSTDEAFFNVKGDEVYKNPPSADAGLHAMVVVGYDDNKRAFRLINSWGTDWGDGGFVWIDYDTFVDKALYGFVAQDLKSDSNVNKGKPTIESFEASPTSVAAGEASTISWSVSGERPLRLTLTSTSGLNEDVSDLKKFELTNIQKETTVTLEAENSEGKTSQSITISIGNPFKVSDVKMDPDGTSSVPFSKEDENRVTVTMNYEAEIPSKYAGLRIWVIPQSNNVTTPDRFYEPSDIVTDTTGQITRYFGVKDSGAFSQTVNSVLIWVEAVIKNGEEGTAREKREPFYSETIDVDYVFMNR